MRLVDIDVVGLEALEGLLDPGEDVALFEPLADARHLQANLGGEHELVATAARLQPCADDGLGLATLVARHPLGIDVGGIDGVEARANEAVEQAEGHRLVRGPTEHVAAEHERRNRDLRPAELALLHGIHPPVVGAAGEDARSGARSQSQTGTPALRAPLTSFSRRTRSSRPTSCRRPPAPWRARPRRRRPRWLRERSKSASRRPWVRACRAAPRAGRPVSSGRFPGRYRA